MEKISVYDRLEITFPHNGLVLPDVINCTVEEELNGKYVLELVHPIDEKGKWEYLVEENIIKADGQLFRIHSTESNLGYVYVYARHIFYDLLHNFLEDVRPTNINGSGALNWILTHTQYPHNFIGMSDIDTLNTQYYIRKNPVEAMLGSDSLVTRWNGELVRDNYTIKLLRQRGANKGSQIAYGKNMLGLEVKRDMDTVITRIMPVGRDGLLLPEKYVDSPLINNYTFPYIRKIEFDVGVDEDTTLEQAYEKLREGARNLYEINKVDIPYININANLLMLENTEEYKHLKNLVKVDLGDIVSCTDNPLKIQFEAKVIRVKKDVLSNRNVEVELGQFKKGISNTIQNAIFEISEELRQNTSDLEKAIANATELLTNALGGYVVKRPGELLIMDTEDINTATEVWRWNLNGLGYSNNGINGPYRLAITMDGKINADFITTGTLNAGIVKTGVLSSKDNKTWINLDDGSFNFKDALKWADNQLKIVGGVVTHNDGSYTLMDGDGVRRKVGNADLYYLNNVTAIFGESIVATSTNPPPNVRLYLPKEMKDRDVNFNISLVDSTLKVSGNKDTAYAYVQIYLDIVGMNLSSDTPYLDIQAYTESTGWGGSGLPVEYRPVSFIVLAISR